MTNENVPSGDESDVSPEETPNTDEGNPSLEDKPDTKIWYDPDFDVVRFSTTIRIPVEADEDDYDHREDETYRIVQNEGGGFDVPSGWWIAMWSEAGTPAVYPFECEWGDEDDVIAGPTPIAVHEQMERLLLGRLDYSNHPKPPEALREYAPWLTAWDMSIAVMESLHWVAAHGTGDPHAPGIDGLVRRDRGGYEDIWETGDNGVIIDVPGGRRWLLTVEPLEEVEDEEE